MTMLFSSLVSISLVVYPTVVFGLSAPATTPTPVSAPASTFPIPPEELIERAKQVNGPEIRLGTKDGGACLADDFQFVAAVVGPLPKEDFLKALASFRLEDSFDIEPNNFGFTVSPLQPNRVYWFNQQVATMTAPFMGVDPKEMQDKQLLLPPQCLHADFDENGKVKEFGFYTVDRQYGNTGGLGGAFGYFYGVGRPLPFPEAKPYKKSLQFRLFSFLGNLARRVGSN